jgi:hypothetical protein
VYGVEVFQPFLYAVKSKLSGMNHIELKISEFDLNDAPNSHKRG